MVSSASYKVFISPETSTWAQINPTWVLLPAEPTSGVDIVETLFDDARRGQAVQGFRQLEGVHRTELSISCPLYPEETGHLFRSILGPDQYTASNGSTPSLHVFDTTIMASATGNSFAIQIQDAALASNESYTHLGCMVTQMTIRFNAGEGLVTMDNTIMGYGMETTYAQASVVDATNNPWRGWQGRVDAGNMTGRLIEGEINISRPSDLVFVARKSKFPISMVPGLIEVTGRMTCSFDDAFNAGTGNLDLYRGVVNEPVRLTFRYCDPSTAPALNIEFPKFSYTDSPAEIDRSGNNMTIGYNFRALEGTVSGTTSYGPANSRQTNIRVALYNQRNSQYAVIP